ncbi:MAG TPA: ABC transporter substrate-binding protein [Pyrinomonadaceae bacterium]|jgi:ABC-type branched-subunit amino acid transport system substrate-binding protein
MIKKLRLYAVFALALAALALSQASAQEQQQQKTPAAAPARGLNAQERRGRAIFLRGESASGREIEAVVGEVDVPGSTMTCAGCHGERGEGKTEGGVTAGNLTWANLTKPYGHTHPTGRKHGPFDEAAFVRAVTEGIDPSKNTMLAAMPRYKLSAEDAADLVAYLKRIEDDHDPGLGDAAVRVGTLLPSQGALAETGAAMRDVLRAYFDDLNGRGGINGRRVELQPAETGANAAATAAAARRLAEEGQVFAFVGGMSAGADAEVAALARELEVPFVGPATLLPQAGAAANRYVFYLMPGLGEQARALVNFHARRRPEATRQKVAVVYTDSAVGAAAASAVEEQCQKAGCGPVQKVAFDRAKFDPAALVRGVKGAEAVFFFGAGGEEGAFIREAEAAAWRPDLFLIGALAGRELVSNVPAGFDGKVFLSFPTVPEDVTEAGAGELRALAAKYKFEVRHAAAQLSALAAAKLFAEGLKRGGREVSRERLVRALEGLYDYDTGLTPRITFGPNRRVGAAGAYVIRIDAGKREFVPASGWVSAY